MSFLDGIISLFRNEAPDPNERRRLIRLKSNFGVLCASAGKAFSATVVDMSIEGMRLQGADFLKKGGSVSVALRSKEGKPTSDGVLCEVMWCRRFKDGQTAGLKYVDSKENMANSWVKKVLKELGFTERSIYQKRRQMRVRTDIGVDCWTTKDGHMAAGHVRNIGVGGALIEIEAPLPANKKIMMTIGPLEKLSTFDMPGIIISSIKHVERQTYVHRVRFIPEECKEHTIKQLGRYVITLLKMERG